MFSLFKSDQLPIKHTCFQNYALHFKPDPVFAQVAFAVQQSVSSAQVSPALAHAVHFKPDPLSLHRPSARQQSAASVHVSPSLRHFEHSKPPAPSVEQKRASLQQLVAVAVSHFSFSLIHAVHTVVPDAGKVSKQAEAFPQHVSFELASAEHVSPASIHVGGGGGACVVEIVVVDGDGGGGELVIVDKTHL